MYKHSGESVTLGARAWRTKFAQPSVMHHPGHRARWLGNGFWEKGRDRTGTAFEKIWIVVMLFIAVHRRTKLGERWGFGLKKKSANFHGTWRPGFKDEENWIGRDNF